MSVAAGSGVWTWRGVQAVSAIKTIMNVKILFIFFLLSPFQKTYIVTQIDIARK
jgi:hypothetical protein